MAFHEVQMIVFLGQLSGQLGGQGCVGQHGLGYGMKQRHETIRSSSTLT